MAVKPDPSRPNRHRMHVGTSGSGKSSRIRELLRREKPPRVIAFDPDEDFPLQRVSDPAAFARALSGAVRSGKRYGIALTCQPSPDSFAWFCRAAWAVANPDQPVVAIVDELAAVSRSPSKAPPAWHPLPARGRKYGLDLWIGTQRPQEVDKTIYSNVGCLWCGLLQTSRDRKLMAEQMDLTTADLQDLEPLEYYERWGAGKAEKGRVKIK